MGDSLLILKKIVYLCAKQRRNQISSYLLFSLALRERLESHIGKEKEVMWLTVTKDISENFTNIKRSCGHIFNITLNLNFS